MPTKDRRKLVARSLSYFLSQDYPNRELIVVDDGATPVMDLVANHPQISCFYLQETKSIGYKRNIACKQATGQIIMHWDDDDWMSDWRISYQVEMLLREQADICGLAKIYFYKPDTQRAWVYSYQGSDHWVYGGSFCYTKDLWEQYPFMDLNIGEDNRFIKRHCKKRILELEDMDFYVGIIHTKNTSIKRTDNLAWKEIPLERINGIMGEDIYSI